MAVATTMRSGALRGAGGGVAGSIVANPIFIAIHKHRGLVIPVAFIAMIMVLLVPLPTIALDLLLVTNLAIATIVLVSVMFVTSPLDLSIFPSLLLGTTLFRLVLNVASTRLILTMRRPFHDRRFRRLRRGQRHSRLQHLRHRRGQRRPATDGCRHHHLHHPHRHPIRRHHQGCLAHL